MKFKSGVTWLIQVLAPERSIVLVTPVWNDSERLGRFGPQLAEALAKSDLPVRWIVADDGSSPVEKTKLGALIGEFAQVYPRVEALFFSERTRKGGAIYQAWDTCEDATWLGFVDADGAVDADSTVRMIQRLSALGPDAGIVGVRHDAADTPVKRPFLRACSFRTFSFLVHRLVGIRFEDTQCGVKFVPGRGYHAVSRQLQERGYIFDVELLLALDRHGCRIEEMRIPWREMPGGKVHPLRDAWAMLAALWRIRRRLRAGRYD
ncbi:glycosyl transferase family 2 [Coraliomargarita akajimensis DSM 45221]|uniref:Glycosyl transferase family 2 n=1 Tax=Coraliomargarita akajimensis (strain DSM 45221 / IAM 15411 / JCM 23193 / KCTC 12865 / 04OKA010-24) TaxID=583355 RepID=D5EQL3_CORAD|nr:glycosyl transferase family 2 [Coraliomargarita akajimensis DSM 45221]